MFGMGGSEIIVILVVALIFLGPDKLPDAAKSISKGIRDLKRSTREIQETIEGDEMIGGAIRDLKSALRGEELASITKQRIEAQNALRAAATVAMAPVDDFVNEANAAAAALNEPAPASGASAGATAAASETASAAFSSAIETVTAPGPELAAMPATPEAIAAVASMPSTPAYTLPASAGEPALDSTLTARNQADRVDDASVAALIRPATGTVAKGALSPAPAASPVEESPEAVRSGRAASDPHSV